MKKLVFLISFVFISGCYPTANFKSMTVEDLRIVKSVKYNNSIQVGSVSGGSETSWITGIPKINNENLKLAIDGSLANNKLLAAGDNAKYRLDVTLVELKLPLGGFSMSVDTLMKYRITGAGSESVVEIRKTGTAEFSEAFIGAARLNIANEKSAYENIKEFIKVITQ